MNTLNFPIHMKLAYMLAIHSFAKDGFTYVGRIIQETENTFTVEIDATEQQVIDLGIKIGYRLNGEAKLIEEQYKKMQTLSDNAQNEFDQRKADRAFKKLFQMFPTKFMFDEWWKTKIPLKLRVNA